MSKSENKSGKCKHCGTSHDDKCDKKSDDKMKTCDK